MAQVRSNEQLQQSAAVAMEKSKEYGTKSWGFLRGVYANVANQVESVASEHGYKVDLGECPNLRLSSWICRHMQPSEHVRASDTFDLEVMWNYIPECMTT